MTQETLLMMNGSNSIKFTENHKQKLKLKTYESLKTNPLATDNQNQIIF
jgi:hypothetical protein